MKTERISRERAGFRSPTGKCRWCSCDVPKRRTFCSEACIHQHKLLTDPGYQSKHVLERDHGICCMCGRDCVKLLESLKEKRLEIALDDARRSGYGCVEPRAMSDAFGQHRKYVPCGHQHCIEDMAERIICATILRNPEFVRLMDSIPLPRHLWSLRRRLWEMDHVTPVIEGGGDCGLDNLRTLCWSCHRQETAALAARRASARKAG